MLLSFDIQNILVLLVGFIGMVYGLIVYSGNKKNKTNIWFFLFVLSVAFWSISMFFFRSSINVSSSIFWAKILYLSATFIPVCFLGFSYIFPEDKIFLRSWKDYLIFVPFIFIATISLLPEALIRSVNIIQGKEKEIIFNKFNYSLYILYINVYFGWNYVVLIKKYFKSSGIIKTQLAYIVIGTLVSTLIGLTTNLLLPTFGIFALNWVGQVGLIVMMTTIFYAILKHHLFDIKIIATEILTFIVWIILLVQFILADTLQAKFLGLSLLSFVSIFGVLLVKSVIKEVNAREQIGKLAKNLEQANIHLKELDKLKSEFVSFATHQIRAPLTAIKGYISLIQEGSYGDVSEKVRGALDKIYQSSNGLALVVGDYLNISRIEIGTMKYNFLKSDFEKLVSEILEELKPTVKKTGLKFIVNIDDSKKYKANIDISKMKQVIINLIDNAVKYTKKGSVTISLSKDEKRNKLLLQISDTGIGISKESMQKLFSKFVRAKNASDTNTQGTGLGLYLAKQMMLAHKGGKLWAESEGEGKGSTFFVELNSI